MRVLVTGSSGFIGRHVVTALGQAGHEVVGLDLHEPLATAPSAETVLGDVRDAAACDRALRGVDAVCHLAAVVGMGKDLQDLPRYAGTNDLGTAVLLAAMHRLGVARLLLGSSMVVYGEGAYACSEHGPVAAPPRREVDLAAGRFEPRCPRCARPLHPRLTPEDAPLDPRSVYAATKAAQEMLSAAWARESGGSATLLRFHNVYGPGMPRDTPYAGVAAIFRSALRRGRPPQVYEDGQQRRDFVHVRDVARAHLAVLASETVLRAARAYNVGSGTVRTVGELAAALSSVVGGPSPEVTGAYRLGDVRHVTADSARLRAELGWSPEVEWEDGMRELTAAP
jgi:dTDP-L-rhamnose 4-epimerase